MEDGLEPEGSEAPEVEVEVESAELTTDEVEVEGADEGTTVEADEPTYTITVAGEEITVPLSELRNGYQRQADYTRKTQELAAERQQLASLKRLESALNEDPAGTIEALRSVFGLQADAEAEDLDPLEREVRELRQWREQQEATALQKRYETEATTAATKHGLEVPAEELLTFAVDNQIGSLDVAARLMKIEKDAEAAAAVTERKTAVTERKRTAAVVEGGRSKTAAAVAPPRPRTIAEAWQLAKNKT